MSIFNFKSWDEKYPKPEPLTDTHIIQDGRYRGCRVGTGAWVYGYAIFDTDANKLLDGILNEKSKFIMSDGKVSYGEFAWIEPGTLEEYSKDERAVY